MPGEENAPTSPPDTASEEADRERRRLYDLLRATTTVMERLDLEEVLRRIVEAAMSLVDARYGALIVIGPDGSSLDRFIHIGVDEPTIAEIGAMPAGKGLIGAVIADGAPIRLEHLAGDPRFSGFPAHHPVMDSFLGVPIRVGDHVYGDLYLTDGLRGPFSDADQELVVALAATAGIAIENARRYDLARAREAWSGATADVMTALLETTSADVLDVITEHVGALIDVDLVSIAVLNGPDEFKVVTASGSAAEAWQGVTFAAADSLSQLALSSRRAARVDSRPPHHPGMPAAGPTVVIPLFAGDEPLGVMSVMRQPGRPAFTEADVDMAFTFAGQAGIGMELVRAREDRRRLEQSHDRARIARDLHDHVIQRLFGAGLSLQAVEATVDARAAAAIAMGVEAVDAAIKDIRTVIFALGSSDRKQSRQPRDRVLNVAAEMAAGMSVTPRLTFSGPLDALVSDDLTDDLTAVLRECLSNITQHADATNVEVALSISEGVVRLVVEDDGRGMPATGRRSGVAHMSDRARLLGGTCTISPRVGGGTRVDWSAPTLDDHHGRAA